MDLGMLKSKVIRILAFINTVTLGQGCFSLSSRQKVQRIRGHKGSACKRPKCIRSLRARTHNIFCSIIFFFNLSA